MSTSDPSPKQTTCEWRDPELSMANVLSSLDENCEKLNQLLQDGPKKSIRMSEDINNSNSNDVHYTNQHRSPSAPGGNRVEFDTDDSSSSERQLRRSSSSNQLLNRGYSICDSQVQKMRYVINDTILNPDDYYRTPGWKSESLLPNTKSNHKRIKELIRKFKPLYGISSEVIGKYRDTFCRNWLDEHKSYFRKVQKPRDRNQNNNPPRQSSSFMSFSTNDSEEYVKRSSRAHSVSPRRHKDYHNRTFTTEDTGTYCTCYEYPHSIGNHSGRSRANSSNITHSSPRRKHKSASPPKVKIRFLDDYKEKQNHQNQGTQHDKSYHNHHQAIQHVSENSDFGIQVRVRSRSATPEKISVSISPMNMSVGMRSPHNEGTSSNHYRSRSESPHSVFVPFNGHPSTSGHYSRKRSPYKESTGRNHDQHRRRREDDKRRQMIRKKHKDPNLFDDSDHSKKKLMGIYIDDVLNDFNELDNDDKNRYARRIHDRMNKDNMSLLDHPHHEGKRHVYDYFGRVLTDSENDDYRGNEMHRKQMPKHKKAAVKEKINNILDMSYDSDSLRYGKNAVKDYLKNLFFNSDYDGSSESDYDGYDPYHNDEDPSFDHNKNEEVHEPHHHHAKNDGKDNERYSGQHKHPHKTYPSDFESRKGLNDSEMRQDVNEEPHYQDPYYVQSNKGQPIHQVPYHTQDRKDVANEQNPSYIQDKKDPYYLQSNKGQPIHQDPYHTQDRKDVANEQNPSYIQDKKDKLSYLDPYYIQNKRDQTMYQDPSYIQDKKDQLYYQVPYQIQDKIVKDPNQDQSFVQDNKDQVNYQDPSHVLHQRTQQDPSYIKDKRDQLNYQVPYQLQDITEQDPNQDQSFVQDKKDQVNYQAPSHLHNQRTQQDNNGQIGQSEMNQFSKVDSSPLINAEGISRSEEFETSDKHQFFNPENALQKNLAFFKHLFDSQNNDGAEKPNLEDSSPKKPTDEVFEPVEYTYPEALVNIPKLFPEESQHVRPNIENKANDIIEKKLLDLPYERPSYPTMDEYVVFNFDDNGSVTALTGHTSRGGVKVFNLKKQQVDSNEKVRDVLSSKPPTGIMKPVNTESKNWQFPSHQHKDCITCSLCMARSKRLSNHSQCKGDDLKINNVGKDGEYSQAIRIDTDSDTLCAPCKTEVSQLSNTSDGSSLKMNGKDSHLLSDLERKERRLLDWLYKQLEEHQQSKMIKENESKYTQCDLVLPDNRKPTPRDIGKIKKQDKSFSRDKNNATKSDKSRPKRRKERQYKEERAKDLKSTRQDNIADDGQQNHKKRGKKERRDSKDNAKRQIRSILHKKQPKAPEMCYSKWLFRYLSNTPSLFDAKTDYGLLCKFESVDMLSKAENASSTRSEVTVTGLFSSNSSTDSQNSVYYLIQELGKKYKNDKKSYMKALAAYIGIPPGCLDSLSVDDFHDILSTTAEVGTDSYKLLIESNATESCSLGSIEDSLLAEEVNMMHPPRWCSPWVEACKYFYEDEARLFECRQTLDNDKGIQCNLKEQKSAEKHERKFHEKHTSITSDKKTMIPSTSESSILPVEKKTTKSSPLPDINNINPDNMTVIMNMLKQMTKTIKKLQPDKKRKLKSNNANKQTSTHSLVNMQEAEVPQIGTDKPKRHFFIMTDEVGDTKSDFDFIMNQLFKAEINNCKDMNTKTVQTTDKFTSNKLENKSTSVSDVTEFYFGNIHETSNQNDHEQSLKSFKPELYYVSREFPEKDPLIYDCKDFLEMQVSSSSDTDSLQQAYSYKPDLKESAKNERKQNLKSISAATENSGEPKFTATASRKSSKEFCDDCSAVSDKPSQKIYIVGKSQDKSPVILGRYNWEHHPTVSLKTSVSSVQTEIGSVKEKADRDKLTVKLSDYEQDYEQDYIQIMPTLNDIIVSLFDWSRGTSSTETSTTSYLNDKETHYGIEEDNKMSTETKTVSTSRQKNVIFEKVNSFQDKNVSVDANNKPIGTSYHPKDFRKKEKDLDRKADEKKVLITSVDTNFTENISAEHLEELKNTTTVLNTSNEDYIQKDETSKRHIEKMLERKANSNDRKQDELIEKNSTPVRLHTSDVEKRSKSDVLPLIDKKRVDFSEVSTYADLPKAQVHNMSVSVTPKPGKDNSTQDYHEPRVEEAITVQTDLPKTKVNNVAISVSPQPGKDISTQDYQEPPLMEAATIQTDLPKTKAHNVSISVSPQPGKDISTQDYLRLQAKEESTSLTGLPKVQAHNVSASISPQPGKDISTQDYLRLQAKEESTSLTGLPKVKAHNVSVTVSPQPGKDISTQDYLRLQAKEAFTSQTGLTKAQAHDVSVTVSPQPGKDISTQDYLRLQAKEASTSQTGLTKAQTHDVSVTVSPQPGKDISTQDYPKPRSEEVSATQTDLPKTQVHNVSISVSPQPGQNKSTQDYPKPRTEEASTTQTEDELYKPKTFDAMQQVEYLLYNNEEIQPNEAEERNFTKSSPIPDTNKDDSFEDSAETDLKIDSIKDSAETDLKINSIKDSAETDIKIYSIKDSAETDLKVDSIEDSAETGIKVDSIEDSAETDLKVDSIKDSAETDLKVDSTKDSAETDLKVDSIKDSTETDLLPTTQVQSVSISVSPQPCADKTTQDFLKPSIVEASTCIASDTEELNYKTKTSDAMQQFEPIRSNSEDEEITETHSEYEPTKPPVEEKKVRQKKKRLRAKSKVSPYKEYENNAVKRIVKRFENSKNESLSDKELTFDYFSQHAKDDKTSIRNEKIKDEDGVEYKHYTTYEKQHLSNKRKNYSEQPSTSSNYGTTKVDKISRMNTEFQRYDMSKYGYQTDSNDIYIDHSGHDEDMATCSQCRLEELKYQMEKQAQMSANQSKYKRHKGGRQKDDVEISIKDLRNIEDQRSSSQDIDENQVKMSGIKSLINRYENISLENSKDIKKKNVQVYQRSIDFTKTKRDIYSQEQFPGENQTLTANDLTQGNRYGHSIPIQQYQHGNSTQNTPSYKRKAARNNITNLEIESSSKKDSSSPGNFKKSVRSRKENKPVYLFNETHIFGGQQPIENTRALMTGSPIQNKQTNKIEEFDIKENPQIDESPFLSDSNENDKEEKTLVASNMFSFDLDNTNLANQPCSTPKTKRMVFQDSPAMNTPVQYTPFMNQTFEFPSTSLAHERSMFFSSRGLDTTLASIPPEFYKELHDMNSPIGKKFDWRKSRLRPSVRHKAKKRLHKNIDRNNNNMLLIESSESQLSQHSADSKSSKNQDFTDLTKVIVDAIKECLEGNNKESKCKDDKDHTEVSVQKNILSNGSLDKSDQKIRDTKSDNEMTKFDNFDQIPRNYIIFKSNSENNDVFQRNAVRGHDISIYKESEDDIDENINEQPLGNGNIMDNSSEKGDPIIDSNDHKHVFQMDVACTANFNDISEENGNKKSYEGKTQAKNKGNSDHNYTDDSDETIKENNQVVDSECDYAHKNEVEVILNDGTKETENKTTGGKNIDDGEDDHLHSDSAEDSEEKDNTNEICDNTVVDECDIKPRDQMEEGNSNVDSYEENDKNTCVDDEVGDKTIVFSDFDSACCSNEFNGKVKVFNTINNDECDNASQNQEEINSTFRDDDNNSFESNMYSLDKNDSSESLKIASSQSTASQTSTVCMVDDVGEDHEVESARSSYILPGTQVLKASNLLASLMEIPTHPVDGIILPPKRRVSITHHISQTQFISDDDDNDDDDDGYCLSTDHCNDEMSSSGVSTSSSSITPSTKCSKILPLEDAREKPIEMNLEPKQMETEVEDDILPSDSSTSSSVQMACFRSFSKAKKGNKSTVTSITQVFSRTRRKNSNNSNVQKLNFSYAAWKREIHCKLQEEK